MSTSSAHLTEPRGAGAAWQAGTVHTSLDTSTGPWEAALFARVRPQGVKVLRHSDSTRIHLPEPPTLRDWEREAQHEPLSPDSSSDPMTEAPNYTEATWALFLMPQVL